MPTPKSPLISVIIPVYNEELCLEELCQRLFRVLKTLGSHEVWFVDDGSRDGSLALLLKLQKKYKPLKVIRFARNFGQHPAVTAGMEQSRGRIIVTLDADLQNPPEEIPKLVKALKQGYDIAAGWRQQRGDSIFRTLPSRIVNRLISRLTKVELHDYGCMLRAYDRRLVEEYLKCRERFSYITALMSLLTANVIEIPVRHEVRQKGNSKYNFLSLFRFVFNILIGFSDYPLRIVNGLGGGLLIAGTILEALLLWKEAHLSPGGETFGLLLLIPIFMILLGVQFLFLGLLGGYLTRIYSEVRDRPRFSIQKIYGKT